MKCTVVAGELLDALRSVQARTKGNVLAILSHVRFGVDKGRLSLLGHDMDSSSEAFVDVDSAETGECAIPAEPLARLIAGLPKSTHVVIAQEGQFVTIKTGRSRYKLPVMETKDFPAALSAEGGLSFKVTAEDVQQLFVRPAGALDPKDQRPMAMGVFVHEEKGCLVGAGYAAYNLFRFATDIPANGFGGVMVPRSSIDEIAKIGPGDIRISDRILEIRTPSRVYCSKLIDATFPGAYRKMLPEAAGAYFDFDRDWFMSALSRLAAISDFSGEKLLDVTLSQDEASAALVGVADGIETMECETVDSSGKTFCMPVAQLLRACQALNGEKLRIFLRREMDPVLIYDPEEPTAVNVQMPCVSKTHKAMEAA